MASLVDRFRSKDTLHALSGFIIGNTYALPGFKGCMLHDSLTTAFRAFSIHWRLMGHIVPAAIGAAPKYSRMPRPGDTQPIEWRVLRRSSILHLTSVNNLSTCRSRGKIDAPSTSINKYAVQIRLPRWTRSMRPPVGLPVLVGRHLKG